MSRASSISPLSLASSLATMFESDICEMSLEAATSPPEVEPGPACELSAAVPAPAVLAEALIPAPFAAVPADAPVDPPAAPALLLLLELQAASAIMPAENRTTRFACAMLRFMDQSRERGG